MERDTGGDELSHSILLGQDRIVELIALGVAATEVFAEICQVAARRFGGVNCAILIADTERARLSLVAASGVPEAMAEALTALDPARASDVFPALAGGGPQVVESIAREPRWAALSAAARNAGLDAAWSSGIRTPGRKQEEPAEGMLLFLLPGERRPSSRGLRVLEMLARLAGMALERDRLTRDREREASLDPLTRLPSRPLFDRLLADLVELASPDHTRFALVLVDLDRFAALNRALGPSTGDLLLRSFGHRLRHALREGDLAARLEGDCFALLVRLEGKADEAQGLAERLVATVRQGFEFGKESVGVTASLGIALYPWDGLDPAALVAHAELALRAGQLRGGDRASFYSPALAEPPRALAVAVAPPAPVAEPEEAFRVADLELLWEPVLELATRRLVALSPIATLPRPGNERISGADLWRLAARGGALAAANRWWASAAIEQAAGWIGKAPGHLVLSLAVVGPQTADGGLTATLNDLFSAHRALASRFEVVLPELPTPRDLDGARELLASLAAIGVRGALGEIGSGPLPLDLLVERPTPRWRLATSAVRAATRTAERGDLLEGLLTLAHRLGARVEAAGVESARDLSWLVAHRCDWASGRAVRAPLDTSEVRLALLESGDR